MQNTQSKPAFKHAFKERPTIHVSRMIKNAGKLDNEWYSEANGPNKLDCKQLSVVYSIIWDQSTADRPVIAINQHIFEMNAAYPVQKKVKKKEKRMARKQVENT